MFLFLGDIATCRGNMSSIFTSAGDDKPHTGRGHEPKLRDFLGAAPAGAGQRVRNRQPEGGGAIGDSPMVSPGRTPGSGIGIASIILQQIEDLSRGGARPEAYFRYRCFANSLFPEN